MKCPKCGYKQAIHDDINEWWHCPQCHGSGEVQMTNEEWFCQLTTEEKAKWLSRNSKFMYGCGRMETTPKVMYEEDWEMWLKEIHHAE